MRQRLHRQRDEQGFTLFELLIVIIVLGILAGIVVFAVGTQSANAATTACQADAQTMLKALEQYKAEVGVYPGDPSLQVPAGTVEHVNGNTYIQSTPPVALVTYGNTWDISGFQLSGYFGLLGDPTQPGGMWKDPATGAMIGPFLRQLPAQNHYEIATDGAGNVYVLPPGTTPPKWGQTLAAASPNSLTSGTNPDMHQMDVLQNPAICSDPDVVQ